MAKVKKVEGAQFVQYFGPLLDALRGLEDRRQLMRLWIGSPRTLMFRKNS